MPNYWDKRSPDAKNLRLLVAGEGWKAYSDKLSDDKRSIELPGSKDQIESALLNALNSTNLLLLTGAGASFAASNSAGKPSAPGLDDLWTSVEQSVGAARFAEAVAQFSNAAINKNIEKLLSLCKIYLELNETAQEASDEGKRRIASFVRDAEKAILARVSFVDIETQLDSHSAIIWKVGRRGIRKPRARFFTTNYDLCFEEAARRHRFTVIDGFSHSLDQIYDRSHFDFDLVRREAGKDAPDYVANVFHLYKLHGSVDWRRVAGEIVRSRGDDGSPLLIYPRASKYQEAFETPYLDMFGALQAALREPDTALIVSGFGFKDEHISRPVMAALEANMNLRLVICDPAFVLSSDELKKEAHVISDDPTSRGDYFSRFQKLAESGDPRVHLINGRFSDLAIALPDLVGETDRERHMNRVRAMRAESGVKP